MRLNNLLGFRCESSRPSAMAWRVGFLLRKCLASALLAHLHARQCREQRCVYFGLRGPGRPRQASDSLARRGAGLPGYRSPGPRMREGQLHPGETAPGSPSGRLRHRTPFARGRERAAVRNSLRSPRPRGPEPPCMRPQQGSGPHLAAPVAGNPEADPGRSDRANRWTGS